MDDLISRAAAIELIESRQRELCPVGMFGRHAVYGTDREKFDHLQEIIDEIGPEPEEDPICEYDFLGTTGFGFEVPTEDDLACNFICAEIGSQTEREAGVGHKLFTILTTAKTYEDIDDLLDLVEQNISFE